MKSSDVQTMYLDADVEREERDDEKEWKKKRTDPLFLIPFFSYAFEIGVRFIRRPLSIQLFRIHWSHPLLFIYNVFWFKRAHVRIEAHHYSFKHDSYIGDRRVYVKKNICFSTNSEYNHQSPATTSANLFSSHLGSLALVFLSYRQPCVFFFRAEWKSGITSFKYPNSQERCLNASAGLFGPTTCIV